MVIEGKHFALTFITISTLLGAVGQVLIKQGLNTLGTVELSRGIVDIYLKMFLSPLVIIGISIYFFGVFFWLYGLSKVDLSLAFPLVSISYVAAFLLSMIFLGESIPVLRWIGLLTICLGVFLVGRS